MPGLGVDSFIHIKQEVTAWGTPETTGFHTLPFISEALTLEISEIESQSIVGGAARQDPLQGGKLIRGTVEFELTYNLIEHFLEGCFGSLTESTPSTGTLTRDHWAELSTSMPSYTIEVNRGDIEAVDKVFIYSGMKVDEITFNIPEQGNGTLSVVFIGQDEESLLEGSPVSAGGLITNTAIPVLAHHLATGYSVGVAADTGAYCIRSVNVHVARGLAERFCLGDQQTKEPIVTEFATVDGSFEIEFDDRNIYERFDAFTFLTAGQLVFEDTAIIETALTAELEFKLNRMKFSNPSAPTVNDRGILVATCPWVGSGNGGVASDGTPDDTSTLEPIAIRTRNEVITASL